MLVLPPEHLGVGCCSAPASSWALGAYGPPVPEEQSTEVRSPTAGVVTVVRVAGGQKVPAGAVLLLVEVMKTEVPVTAPAAGTVAALDVVAGDQVREGQVLARVSPGSGPGDEEDPEEDVDLDAVPPLLADLRERHGRTWDEARPEAVAKVHARGRRTARENLADLLDEGSFREYGPLLLAAQERRRPREELEREVPADGLVGGLGTVDGTRVVVASYDASVLAGTQGLRGHDKLDRLLTLAFERRLPVVLFCEGGGGRPGDVDVPVVSALDTLAFGLLGRLSGRVPLVAVASGRCFAGNAALLGCCDVVVATEDATIGLGGPAMIAGGGLGDVTPEEVGPVDVQHANGVVDLRVADDAAAVAAVREHLALVAGPYDARHRDGWEAPDPRVLRHLVPERRTVAVDVRAVVAGICDTGSVVELRSGFGRGVVTALGRVEGRPLALLATDSRVLGGALDADGSDKAARFLQLCDARDLPVLSLLDTPGFLVGPQAEATGTVRHCARLFVVGAALRVPLGAVVLRKAYGLGAQAMMGGSTRAPRFTLGWPTAELGPMGLEGAVRLGMRRELAEIADDDAREQRVTELTAALQEHARGVNAAAYGEVDDVVDPAETRRWATLLTAEAATRPPRPDAERRFVDPW